MAVLFQRGPDSPTHVPDRVWMEVPEFDQVQAREAAHHAVNNARRLAPKLSAASSRRFVPIYGVGWYGIHWMDNHVWYQETGIRPFTMRNLAGKTIPMWVDDPSGETRRENPDAETRRTADGRIQVLIFRKAARQGERKRVRRRVAGVDQWVMVPKSYPGAPGRIAVRDPQGRIARGNVGVRWRHPGMGSKGFLYEGMVLAAEQMGVQPREVVATNERWT